jgi:hypothetical protein
MLHVRARENDQTMFPMTPIGKIGKKQPTQEQVNARINSIQQHGNKRAFANSA